MIEKRASTQDLLRSSAAVSVLSRRSRRSRLGPQIGSVIGQLPLAKIVLDERSNPEKYTLPGALDSPPAPTTARVAGAHGDDAQILRPFRCRPRRGALRSVAEAPTRRTPLGCMMRGRGPPSLGGAMTPRSVPA